MNKNILIITTIAIVIAVVAISFSGYMTSYAPLPQPESSPSEQPESSTSPPEETPPQEQPPEQPPQEPPQSPPQPQPQTFDVEIRNFAFSPATITIKVGDSVRWTNRDSVGHTATADDNSFDTGSLGQEQSKTLTFDKGGAYDYHCTPHPWMKAKIIVE